MNEKERGIHQDWLNGTEIPSLDWRRFIPNPKTKYKFIFKNFPAFGTKEHMDTTYLLFEVVSCNDYPKLGLIADCNYLLSIPEISFSQAWLLCQKKPKINPKETVDIIISFSRQNRSTMTIYSAQAASIPERECTERV